MHSMVEGGVTAASVNGNGGEAPSVTGLAPRATSPASQGRR